MSIWRLLHPSSLPMSLIRYFLACFCPLIVNKSPSNICLQTFSRSCFTGVVVTGSFPFSKKQITNYFWHFSYRRFWSLIWLTSDFSFLSSKSIWHTPSCHRILRPWPWLSTMTVVYIRGCNDIVQFTDFVTIIYFYYFKINFLHVFELRIIRH